MQSKKTGLPTWYIDPRIFVVAASAEDASRQLSEALAAAGFGFTDEAFEAKLDHEEG